MTNSSSLRLKSLKLLRAFTFVKRLGVFAFKKGYHDTYNITCRVKCKAFLSPQQFPEPLLITKAQQGELYAIVSSKSRACHKYRSHFWTRFQEHFKLTGYKTSALFVPCSAFRHL